MGLTVLAFIGLMLVTFTGGGENADMNPYGAHTIEWSATSPAPTHNFEHVVAVASPTPLLDTQREASAS
jgi:heme/copper-type cytochrome/quinol oxidase subunit 1